MVGVFIILDNVSSSRSWSPEKWRLVHNWSRSAQTFRSFNQLISNHLKDFILDDIQTINFLPSRLYYMILSRSRSPKRRHQDKSASSLLFFFWTRWMRARAGGGERRISEKRGMTGIFFCVSISFIFSVISEFWCHHWPFFLKHCTLLPTTLEMGKINNWTYITTENVLRETLEMAFLRP